MIDTTPFPTATTNATDGTDTTGAGPAASPELGPNGRELATEALVARAPRPTLSACVVIPARDEAASLAAALTALAHQVDRSGQPLDPETFEVVVLANNCRDATAAVARATAARAPALAVHVVERDLPPAAAHIGTARRLLMDEAA